MLAGMFDSLLLAAIKKAKMLSSLQEAVMLSTIGGLVNIGIIIYLGLQVKAGMTPEQYSDLNTAQNPLLLSFVAVLALILATRHK